MFGFLWDLSQQQRINNLERSLASGRPSEALEGHVQRLEDKLESLVLINMALWSFLQEKLGVTEQDLQDRVREIDLRDGQLDGRVTLPPTPCPSCGRIIAAKHARCLYCGTPNSHSSAYGKAQ